MLSFMVVVISVFITFSFTHYSVIGKFLIKNQLDHQTVTAQALCRTLEVWANDCEKISFDIAMDNSIQQYLDNIKDNGVKQSSNSLKKHIESFQKGNKTIQDIYIMDNNYDIVGTGNVFGIKHYIYDRISTSERNIGGVVWDSGYNTESIVLFRTIYDKKYDPNRRLGYLFVIIENTEASNLFDRYRIDDSQRFSLKGIMDGFEVTERGFYYNYYDNYNNLLQSEITFKNWNLRTWIDKTVALEPTKDLNNKLMILGMISIFIVVLLSWILASQITKPISNMKKIINTYGTGNFTAKVKVEGKDEIADLGNILNSMSNKISNLFNEVKKSEKQRRKLELQTLEYQINPHFLYNTLDSINILARQNSDLRMAEMVTSLSRLFRLGLHKGREIVPIRDEVMHVTYYLKIQGIRFEDQLSWDIDIEEDIKNVEIIKFILQPIVENAINHGIRKKLEPGYIHIKGKRDGNNILFQIKDTGSGMNKERLKFVKNVLSGKIDAEGKMGFGLNNVDQRIKLHYGEHYGIEIESEEGHGTIVTISIPI